MAYTFSTVIELLMQSLGLSCSNMLWGKTRKNDKQT